MRLLDSVEEPLKLVDPPYLPPAERAESLYTLVLDLDETLVHYQEVCGGSRRWTTTTKFSSDPGLKSS